MNELPIHIPNCELSRKGAVFAAGLSIQTWKEIGAQLHSVGSCYQFLVGDWLNYGEHEYGEKYATVCEAMGMDYGLMRNWSSVCQRIELSRRRDKLTFTHHVELAKLDIPNQNKWMDLAEQNKWSVADLREKLRDSEAEYANENHGKPVKTFVGYVTNAIRLLNHQADSIPTWSRDERERTAELIRPIVDFYERLLTAAEA